MFPRRLQRLLRSVSTSTLSAQTQTPHVPVHQTHKLHYHDQLQRIYRSPGLFSKLASQEVELTLDGELDQSAQYARAKDALLALADLHRSKKLSERFALDNKTMKQLISLALRTQNQRDLFQLLLRTDVDITKAVFGPLRTTIRKGSAEDVELYEFTEMFSLEPEHQALARVKFLTSYSFDMINQIVVRHIKKDNPDRANKYLELLMVKHQMNKQVKRSDSLKEMAGLYETISFLTIKHGHYNSALQIVGQMRESQVVLTPKLYAIFLASLRHKKQYSAILVLLRQIPEAFKDVSPKVKTIYINEFLRLVRDRFPEECRVFLAHFVEIFPHWNERLNELGLTGMIYLREVKRVPEGYQMAHASVNSFYRVPEPTQENVTELYAAVLNHMARHETNSAHNLSLLFKRYMMFIKKNTSGPFTRTQMDCAVLELFIKHVIAIRQPKLAFHMIKSFLAQVSLPANRLNKQLITYVFHHHGMTKDQAQFREIMELMEQYAVPVDFNMLSALVLKDPDNSKFWYDKLVDMGHTVQLQRLRNKAVREGWELEPLVEKQYNERSWEDPMEFDDEEFADEFKLLL